MKKLIFFFLMMFLLSVGVAQAQQPDWMAITPGGTAVCARGTPYTFFFRAADPQKLLIFFEGGGSCWNDDTCKPGSGLFDESVEGDEAVALQHLVEQQRCIFPHGANLSAAGESVNSLLCLAPQIGAKRPRPRQRDAPARTSGGGAASRRAI